jgi:carbamoyl-phosphate synthase large subunit
VPFEINARFSSTTSMRACFGYNEVEMALRCYVLGERIEPPPPRRGRALRFWDEFYLFAADDAADSAPVVPEAVAARGL